MEKEDKKIELCFLPVYINKTKLLDINSILFDGYSEFSEINYQNEDKNSTSQKGKVSTGIGMSIFSLGSQLESNNSSDNNIISNIALKKIQTSSSLLANTIKILTNKKILTHTPNKTGSFIEIKGVFKNNSIVELLEQIENIVNLSKLSQKLTKEKNNKNDNMFEEIKTIKQMMVAKSNNKLELVCETKEYIYVIKIEDKYLYNCDLSDIYNNELYFFGQVKGIYEKYKFFSDTPLSKFNPEQLTSFIESLKLMTNNGIYDIDFELMTENKIKPVVELDIIAIYRKFD